MAKESTADLLIGNFSLEARRKYEVKGEEGNVLMTLYFAPVTRAARKKAVALANGDDPLELSTQILCQMAEIRNAEGNYVKAFSHMDAGKLQRNLPEKVLNEMELFLFGLNPDGSQQEVKND